MIDQSTNRHSGLPLFAGAFLMALSLSSWWTVMPFNSTGAKAGLGAIIVPGMGRFKTLWACAAVGLKTSEKDNTQTSKLHKQR